MEFTPFLHTSLGVPVFETGRAALVTTKRGVVDTFLDGDQDTYSISPRTTPRHPLSIIDKRFFDFPQPKDAAEKFLKARRKTETPEVILDKKPKTPTTKNTRVLIAIAKELELDFLLNAEPATDHIQSFFSEALGTVISRPKEIKSILMKLIDKGFLEDIEKHTHNGITQEAMNELRKIAHKKIYDGIGTRLLLNFPNINARDALLFSLLASISSKHLVLTRIRNYRGLNISPYLTQKEIDRIVRLQERVWKKEKPITVLEGKDCLKASGATFIGLDCIGLERDGKEFFFDLQIMSEEINRLLEIEGLYYKSKPKPKTKKEIPLSFFPQKVREAVALMRSLSKKQREAYEQYLFGYFAHVRNLEMGKNTQAPFFPSGLVPQSLTLDALAKLIEKK